MRITFRDLIAVETAIILTAVLSCASTIIAVLATIKTLIDEHNRVQTEQRLLNEQIGRVRQLDSPKVITTSLTVIRISGLQLG